MRELYTYIVYILPGGGRAGRKTLLGHDDDDDYGDKVYRPYCLGFRRGKGKIVPGRTTRG